MKLSLTKKIVTIIVLVFVATTTYVNCTASTVTIGVLEYEISDSFVTVVGYTGSATGAVEIPSEINGKPVTSVGEYVFSNCSELTSITIPNSITNIGKGSFYKCSSITDVYYFGNESSWESINIDTTSSFFLSDGNKYLINADRHYPIPVLEQLPTCKEEGMQAFSYWSDTNPIEYIVEPVVIPKSEHTQAEPLIENVVPATNTEEGHYDSVVYCSVCGLELNRKTIHASILDGMCGEHLIWGYDHNNHILTISGTGKMESYYHGNSGGQSYGRLPPWELYRGEIKQVIINEGVLDVGDMAFSSCTELTSITISDSITRIGYSSFSNCQKLTSVNLPNSVSKIDEYAFSRCISLRNINIPDRVTKIGDWSFFNCPELVNITIPGSVSKIGSEAFMYCSGLKTIVLSDGITSIGQNAFTNCLELTEIIIPESVMSIEDNSFHGCSGLERLIVDINNPVYHSKDNCIIDTESKELILGCKNSVIPNDGSVTKIGRGAFYGCKGLKV